MKTEIKLLKLINELLESKITYFSFENEFYLIFSETNKDLSENIRKIIWEIEDKVAYTTEIPTKEEIKYGYSDSNEFKNWIIGIKYRLENEIKNEVPED